MTSHLTILIGRPGLGKTERALAKYQSILEDAQINRKIGSAIWIAPTQLAQRSVVDRLVTSTRPVQIAPQVVTFELFAEKILSASGRPATAISSVTKRLLLRRIVSALDTRGMLTNFAPVVRTSGFLNVVSSFISELKREEHWPEEFLSACDETHSGRKARDRELGMIYQCYQDQLAANNWYDNEGRFWLARTALAEGVRKPFERVEHVVIDGFADFTQTQYEIIGHLLSWDTRVIVTLPIERPTDRPELFEKSEEALRRILHHRPGKATVEIVNLADASSLLETTSKTTSAGSAPSGIEQIRVELFSNPRSIRPCMTGDGIELIAATGPMGEYSSVARRIKHLFSQGVSPREIVVAVRSLAESGQPWRDFLSAAGIPTTCDARAPLISSPLVKAVFTILMCELEDWPFARLMAVLDSNLFHPEWPEFQKLRSPRSVAFVLRRLKIHRGREIALRVVSRISVEPPKRVLSEAGDDEDDLPHDDDAILMAEGRRASRILGRLSRTLEPLRRKHSLSEWADVISMIGAEVGWATDVDPVVRRDWDLLQRIVRTAAEADEKLAESDLGVQSTLVPNKTLAARSPRESGRTSTETGKSAGHPRFDLSEFVDELRDLLERETTPNLASQAGGVRILDVEQARHLSSSYLFVVELSESSFPQNRTEDCLFSETERLNYAQRGIRLSHHERRQQDEMFLYYSLVSRPTRRLTLSFPAINRKGQPVFPSPYVSALRSLFGSSALTIAHEGTLDPVPDVENAMSQADQRLAAMSVVRKGRPGLFVNLLSDPEVRKVGLNLLAIAQVNSNRFQTRGFTVFEGRFLNSNNLECLNSKFGLNHQFSATELEGYATCPFRFWLSKVMSLESLPTPEEGTDYARRGSLIHAALAHLLRDGLNRSEEDLAAAFQKFIADELSRHPHETELQRALNRIEQDLLNQWGAAFAKQQAEYRERQSSVWTGVKPSLEPEVAFGRLPDQIDDPSDAGQPGNRSPLLVGMGTETVAIRGRIDRVDVGMVAGQNVYTVIDYKTGMAPKSSDAELRTGRAIQLAIYALAVRRLNLCDDAVPFHMGYWLLKTTGFKRGYQRETKSFEGLDSSVVTEIEAILDKVVPKLVRGIRRGAFLVENADQDCTGHCPYHMTCRVNQVRPVAESLHKIGDILV